MQRKLISKIITEQASWFFQGIFATDRKKNIS